VQHEPSDGFRYDRRNEETWQQRPEAKSGQPTPAEHGHQGGRREGGRKDPERNRNEGGAAEDRTVSGRRIFDGPRCKDRTGSSDPETNKKAEKRELHPRAIGYYRNRAGAYGAYCNCDYRTWLASLTVR